MPFQSHSDESGVRVEAPGTPRPLDLSSMRSVRRFAELLEESGLKAGLRSAEKRGGTVPWGSKRAACRHVGAIPQHGRGHPKADVRLNSFGGLLRLGGGLGL